MLGRDPITGFVITVPATPRQVESDLATRYLDKAWEGSGARELAAARTAVVIGVNRFERLDPTDDGAARKELRSKLADIDRREGLVMAAFGFLWEPRWVHTENGGEASLAEVRRVYRGRSDPSDRRRAVAANEDRWRQGRKLQYPTGSSVKRYSCPRTRSRRWEFSRRSTSRCTWYPRIPTPVSRRPTVWVSSRRTTRFSATPSPVYAVLMQSQAVAGAFKLASALADVQPIDLDMRRKLRETIVSRVEEVAKMMAADPGLTVRSPEIRQQLARLDESVHTLLTTAPQAGDPEIEESIKMAHQVTRSMIETMTADKLRSLWRDLRRLLKRIRRGWPPRRGGAR